MSANRNTESTICARVISLLAVTTLIPRAGESGTTDKTADTHRFHHRAKFCNKFGEFTSKSDGETAESEGCTQAF